MKYSPSEQRSYWQQLPRKVISVGALIFDKQKRILLVKPEYKDYWSQPGGVVEKNESPRAALIRETKEEIDLDVELNRLLSIGYFQKDITGQVFDAVHITFLAKLINNRDFNFNDGEIEDLKWATLSEAKGLLNERGHKRLQAALRGLADNTVIYYETLL